MAGDLRWPQAVQRNFTGGDIPWRSLCRNRQDLRGMLERILLSSVYLFSWALIFSLSTMELVTCQVRILTGNKDAVNSERGKIRSMFNVQPSTWVDRPMSNVQRPTSNEQRATSNGKSLTEKLVQCILVK